MSESIETYRLRKFIYSIIFNFHENDYEEDPECFDLMIVESLRNVVEYLTYNNYLSNSVKENINNYLMQARYYNDENRSKRIELINDIIGFLNSQKKDESIIFYRLQLFDRRKDFGYIFKYSDDVIKKEIENIHDSICHDLYMIVGQTNITSEEDFENEYLPYFQNSNLYYESLNIFLKENPSLFKDKTFYNRMMKVINLNNEFYKENKYILKMNKKIVKRVNKKMS